MSASVRCPRESGCDVCEMGSRLAVLEDCDRKGQSVSVTAGVRHPDGRLLPLPAQAGGRFTPADVTYLRQRYGDDCYLCGGAISQFSVDHVWASVNGGPHARWNWRLTHPECNSRKNGRMAARVWKCDDSSCVAFYRHRLAWDAYLRVRGAFMRRGLPIECPHEPTGMPGVLKLSYPSGTAACLDDMHCRHWEHGTVFCHCAEQASMPWAA